MKRSRQQRRGGLGKAAEQLIRLACGLIESGSRAEDRYWEAQLCTQIDERLAQHDEEALNTALDHLFSTEIRAYEELADFIESRAENALGVSDDHEVLLLAAPVLAWSRFRIPSQSIPAAALSNLRTHLQTHVLAKNARLAVADYLFSPDQLPQGYCATAELAGVLGRAALQNQNLHIDTANIPETVAFLSDTRYLLAAVAVPRGQPLFSWQENHGSRDKALAQWRNQGGACITPLMAGCSTEIVLPEAYFAACRQAERASRPYSVRASVAFLGAELQVPASGLRATIAPFYDKDLQEYRIGFALNNKDTTVHGVVWPILGPEDAQSDTVSEIETVLRESGITDIVALDHQFPVEYCDDCGSPLYPTADSEVAHAEMPEDHDTQQPRHLH